MRKLRPFLHTLATTTLVLGITACEICKLENITTDALPAGTVGVGYRHSVNIDTVCEPEYLEFTVTGGNLPPGLTFTDRGRLEGTPTVAGEYSFTVLVRACFVDTGFRLEECNTKSKGITVRINAPSSPAGEGQAD